MTALWPLTAILFSIGISVYALLNQQIKASPTVLAFWRNIGVGVITLPLLFFINLPSQPIFYVAVVATGVLSLIFDITFFKNAARLGAGVVSRLIPLGVVLTFIIWGLVSPNWRQSFLSLGIIQQGAIILALVGCTLSVMIMKKSRYDVIALKRMMPIILSVAMIDVLTKVAMDSAALMAGIISYICLQGLTAGILLVLYQAVVKKTPISIDQVTKNGAWNYGVFLIIIVVFILVCKTASIAWASNPSYVSAIGLLSPFWVDIYNRFKKVPDRSNQLAGFVVVLSVAVLILVTA
jgi:hypothetical protein